MSEQFELFWEESTITPPTAPAFGSRVLSYEGTWSPRLLTYPGEDIELAVPRDRLMRRMQQRRSERSFAPGHLTKRQLGSLFAAFGRGAEGRVFPSAGGLYPVEVFCLAIDVEGELDGKIVCYNADSHSVSVVSDCPSWEACTGALNHPFESRPQAVFIFVLLLDAMLAKYGSRAGRFGLIEVGHAAHGLALRLTEEKLAGFELGGLLDREVLQLLNLQNRSAKVALGYACGLRGPHPPRP
jgi:SagB-type dehydrogenase family enzyme